MAPLADECWQVDDLTIEVDRQAVSRNGSPIVLPKLSFKFLLALVRAAPRLLSTDELMEIVWEGVFVNGETVTQRAKLLRDALGDDAREPRYFAVRRGAGYHLIPPAVRVDRAEGAAQSAGRGFPLELVKQPRRRRAIMTAIALGVVCAGGPASPTDWTTATAIAPRASLRVAVLAFDNLSGDPADAFIARSIPEMVLNRLSSVSGLTVIARDSALLSQVASAPTREAARRLDAAFVVKGSVQRVGDTLRVTCFVVDVGRQARIWSERFDWPVGRIYALQDRIAERVAASLEGHAHGLGPLPAHPRTAHGSDAYLAYLKGKSLLSRFTVAETDAATAQFTRAIRLDPRFPEALVALFDASMQGAFLRKDDLAVFRARHQRLLDEALRLDPGSGSAMFAKAMWSDLPAGEREEVFRRAAERDPSNTRGLTAYAEFLDGMMALPGAKIARENPAAAKALVDRVLAIDPLSSQARWWAVQRGFTRLPPEAIERDLARELAIDPLNYVIGERYAFRRWMFSGETAEAIEKIERTIATDPKNPSAPHFAVAFYLDANDPAAARAVADTTPASRDASLVLFAQYRGDWRKAGEAAFDRRGFLFHSVQNWNWPEAIRDHALRTRDYDRAAQAIAARYRLDLRDPRVVRLEQTTAAPALGQILLVSGDRVAGTQLLAETVRWIDAHPSFGLAGMMRTRARAMMLLGDREQALSNLRASVETGHDIRFWWYLVDRDPVWEPVRNDPRFKAIAAYCREAAAVQRAKLEALRRAGQVPVRTAGATA